MSQGLLNYVTVNNCIDRARIFRGKTRTLDNLYWLALNCFYIDMTVSEVEKILMTGTENRNHYEKTPPEEGISHGGAVSAGITGGAIGVLIYGAISTSIKSNDEPNDNDTYRHIKIFFENSGVKIIPLESKDTSSEVDLIVDYEEEWELDIKNYLKVLKIIFKDPISRAILAEGVYEASIAHDYPDSKREFPNVLTAILSEFSISRKEEETTKETTDE
jgi:hypothetical protein